MRIAIIILLAGYALAKQAHTEHATVRSPQEEVCGILNGSCAPLSPPLSVIDTPDTKVFVSFLEISELRNQIDVFSVEEEGYVILYAFFQFHPSENCIRILFLQKNVQNP